MHMQERKRAQWLKLPTCTYLYIKRVGLKHMTKRSLKEERVLWVLWAYTRSELSFPKLFSKLSEVRVPFWYFWLKILPEHPSVRGQRAERGCWLGNRPNTPILPKASCAGRLCGGVAGPQAARCKLAWGWWHCQLLRSLCFTDSDQRTRFG